MGKRKQGNGLHRAKRGGAPRLLGKLLAGGLALALVAPGVAWAQAQPGECASGFCGTPNNNGGGCGCGCGGSILVNNTDIGETYSTSDDYDGDGIEDDFDTCPFIANRDQGDSDGDGAGNACDTCPNVANETQADLDGDGMGDPCDDDSDNDTLANGADNCPGTPNRAQRDTDGDGRGDSCDDDADNDGVPNRTDNCPLIANADQTSVPGGGGAACDNDTDGDGVDDSRDLCPEAYDPEQKDADADKVGDACDQDQDADGVPNNIDNCPLVANPDQEDADHDGKGDTARASCDLDGFCFVAGKNPTAACLDPRDVFQVTASPRVAATTGDPVNLGLYANRENTAMKYSFAITKRPGGSEATIDNPVGNVSTSEAYEYRFGDERPVFVPDLPGTYEITLGADLVGDDALFPGKKHAQTTLQIEVTGEAKTSGCEVGAPGRGSRSTWAFGLAAMLVALCGHLALRRK